MMKRSISSIKLLAVILAVLMLPVTALAAPTGFTDVPADAYYKTPVSWAVEQSITTGTSATTFSPDNTCTRAQILTFLWRAAGSPVVDTAPTFADVKETDYFCGAACWAVEKKIISLDGNRFEPNTPCTRAATVEYLWRYAGAPAAAGAAFTDVAANTELAKAVSWAVANGVTNGTSATTFSPDSTCTRGQIVTFLYRAFAEDSKLPEAPDKDGYVNDGGEAKTDAELTGRVAGKMADGQSAKKHRPAPNPGASKNTAMVALNNLAFYTYGGLRFFDDGIAENYEDTGKFAKFVTHSDGRTGINVFGWRKSYDSSIATNACLNVVLEAFYYMTGDRQVAKALWDVVDYMSINGAAATTVPVVEGFGFTCSNETSNGINLSMNGVDIRWEWGGGNSFYFN